MSTYVRIAAIFLCFGAFGLLTSCGSVPNLEQSECTAARDTVKRFYSFHFGNEMAPSVNRNKRLAPFLTPDLVALIDGAADERHDYFTNSVDYPKAFRVGECSVGGPEKVTMQVILLWKNDEASTQKAVAVEAVKRGDKWLVDRVF